MLVRLTGWLLLVACSMLAVAAERTASERLGRLRQEIARLRQELAELGGREQGVLGELETLQGELRLRRAELSEVELRIEEIRASIDSRERRLADLRVAQRERRSYLAFRVREMYKGGRHEELRRLVGGGELASYGAGLRYASFLSQRDRRVLNAYRADAGRIREEQAALERRGAELEVVRRELVRTRTRLQSTRRQRTGLLARIREDKTKREAAIEELRAAATRLGQLIDSLPGEVAAPTLDVHKFRGLLDWPAEGPVSTAFGTSIHPRFRTEVPHPGLDIEAETGTPIRTIFDGRVVFAEWLRGYGLTAIVDHGGGLLSVYAHASVLVVESGDDLVRGQLVGQVGDTGSLRGPYLYFELRLGGRPTDPASWLRRR